MSLEPKYNLVDGIKIYDGTTEFSRRECIKNIAYLEEICDEYENPFTEIQPSTLTAQGLMSNVSFIEESLINMLSPPINYMLKIGCNYGELFSEDYVIPPIKKTSGRGRKPKQKKKTKRKVQGTGKYFSSQITFDIRHPDTGGTTEIPIQVYKIKLFRNGVFQVPGVKDPNMLDLVKPIKILREYLSYNMGEDVQVLNFMAVMRNYKARLVDTNCHVHLEKLEELIIKEKVNNTYNEFIEYMLQSVNVHAADIIKKRIGTFNPMSIAEMTYNTDRCVCLIIKFYRPNLINPQKKTTVKLLKKGKINFDGGNSEQVVIELYTWLRYIYNKYADKILFDVRKITDDSDSDTSECSDISIYDGGDLSLEDEESSDENDSEINSDTDNKPKKIIKYKKTVYKRPPRHNTQSNEINRRSVMDINIMKALRNPIKPRY